MKIWLGWSCLVFVLGCGDGEQTSYSSGAPCSGHCKAGNGGSREAAGTTEGGTAESGGSAGLGVTEGGVSNGAVTSGGAVAGCVSSAEGGAADLGGAAGLGVTEGGTSSSGERGGASPAEGGCAGAGESGGARDGGSAGESGGARDGGSAGESGGARDGGSAGEGACGTGGWGGTAGTTGRGGVAGVAGSVGCTPSCDDANPCTTDACDQRLGCTHAALQESAVCDDGSPCTSNDVCVSGTCVGTPVTSPGAVVSSAFAFGAELQPDVDSSGGLSAFLSDDRMVFADRLDGSGTLLTVVRIEGGALHIEAQALTSTQLMSQPYSSWMYQSYWATHLIPLGPTRFAVENGMQIQVFELTDGQLTELSRSAMNVGGTNTQDAVATTDGQIWICGMGIHRFRVDAAGAVEKARNVKFNGILGGCKRIAVAPDGRTVYADAARDVVRLIATDAPDTVAEVVLPNTASLGLAIDKDFAAVQRAKNLAYGDLELYRNASSSLVESASETTRKTPFGVGLLDGQYLQLWEHRSDDQLTREQLVKWSEAGGAGEERAWVFRKRTEGINDWYQDSANLASRGRLLLFQPWRRLLKLNDDHSGFEDITGPGHGTIRELVSLVPGSVVTAGPYAMHRVQLDDTAISFVAGGTQHDAGLAPPLQVVLPAAGIVARSAFVGRSLALSQRVATQSVNLMQASAAGVSSLGAATLAGGPATLLTRGDSLYQVAQSGPDAFTIRRYPLSAELVGTTSPLVPSLELNVIVDAPELPSRGSFTVEIDEQRAEAVIVEVRSPASGLSESTSHNFLWFTWRDGPVQILAARRIVSRLDPSQVALRDGRAMVFGQGTSALFQANLGQFEQLASFDVPDILVRNVLGLDGSTRVYVAAFTGLRQEVLVFDWADASLRARYPLPAQGISMVRNGARLVVATKGSVHLVTPTCGDVTPTVATEWPVPDAHVTIPQAPCKALAACLAWQAPPQPGDVDRNGCVDGTDIDIAANCLGQVVDECTQSVLADLDGNGVVDDFYIVTEHFGEGC